MTRPIAVDLFCGAGGMSLGFEQAGFDVVAAVEVDPVHAAVHEYNFANSATLCRDISTLTGAEIRKAAKIGKRPLDLVVGGAPCQGFSMIGHRALQDPRNALVAEFVRIVCELDARYFVFENVKGLTVGKGLGQIEIDELYFGLDRRGCHYVIPVQAKGGSDQISVVQTKQDIAWCQQRFPGMQCRAISAQFMPQERVAMFHLDVQDDMVKIVDERHYKLVPASDLDDSAVRAYRD